MSDVSDLSSPVLEWFGRTYGSPSPVQARVWPLLARGDTVLFSSPTGTGKTLAAFLVPLDRLLTGEWEGGKTRVLYVSPLKALNNDIRRNLMEPLESLQEVFRAAGREPCAVRVMTRSGDTLAKDRRNLRNNPPEILITTPESLAILLNQTMAPALFADLKLIILDEIHAVMESKRGSMLSVMLEKLELISPGIQRVGISATVQPIEEAAAYLAGWAQDAQGRQARRPVSIVQEKGLKEYRIDVCLPRLRPIAEEQERHYWESLGLELRRIVKSRRRTLIFCNSRRVCETIARFINGIEAPRKGRAALGNLSEPVQSDPLVYPHHGSLSRELRLTVELGLKEGRIKGIVATSSLELGIDIGDLDQVVLVQAPASTSSALQRAGRSGHRPDQASSLLVYPSHGLDSMRCAVLARAVADQELEDLRMPRSPLDILVQGVLAFCLDRVWKEQELFGVITAAHAFHTLGQEEFSGVIDLLLGCYESTRLAELEARLVLMPDSGPAPDRCFTASPQARLLLFSRGGSIPGRGTYRMKGPDGTQLGELDEEFIWERRKGDRFFLGNRVWEIVTLDEQAVTVKPSSGFAMLPFWRGEEMDLSHAMSCRVIDLMESAELHLSRGDREGFAALLRERFFMQPDAAEGLVDFLGRQRDNQGVLPGHRRVLVEKINLPERPDELLWVLQTFWGSKVNRPFAFLLAQCWKSMTGQDMEYYLGNEGLLVMLPSGQDLVEILDRLPARISMDHLREGLWNSVWFASRFRENAGRALLLGGGFGVRTPLWLLRRRSSRLLATLSRFPLFPVIRETWRQCFEDELELDALAGLIDRIKQGLVQFVVSESDQVSEFGQSLLWKHTNTLMYQPDNAGGAVAPDLVLPKGNASHGGEAGDSLWEEAFRDTAILPPLDDLVLGRFAERMRPLVRMQRDATDPSADEQDARDCADFLARAKFLPRDEWQELVRTLPPDHFTARDMVIHGEGVMYPPFRKAVLACRKKNASEDESNTLAFGILDHLSCSVPRSLAFLSGLLGVDQLFVQELLEPFVQDGRLVPGAFSSHARQGSFLEYCTADNLEYLYRLVRKNRRATVPVLDAPQWASFLGFWQGLGPGTAKVHSPASLRSTIRSITAFELPAAQWEQSVFPLRFSDWNPSTLDALCLDQGLSWRGRGGKSHRLWWVFPQDEWFMEAPAGELMPPFVQEFWPDHRPLGFHELLARVSGSVPPGMTASQLEEALWEGVWKGTLSNQDPALLRRAISRNFAPLPVGGSTEGVRKAPSFREWERHRMSRGAWYPLGVSAQGGDGSDGFEQGEILRERCRLLLDRYGIVHPRLLQNEMPGFRWQDLGFTFRLMELSGEIEAGYLLRDLGPLQYAWPEVMEQLRHYSPSAGYWLQGATDPSSLCGLGLVPGLPARKSGTWLVWEGPRLLWIWQDGGSLESPDPQASRSGLESALVFLFQSLDRLEMAALFGGTGGKTATGRRVLHTINGKTAIGSAEWLGVLGTLGFRRSADKLIRFRPV